MNYCDVVALFTLSDIIFVFLVSVVVLMWSSNWITWYFYETENFKAMSKQHRLYWRVGIMFQSLAFGSVEQSCEFCLI